MLGQAAKEFRFANAACRRTVPATDGQRIGKLRRVVTRFFSMAILVIAAEASAAKCVLAQATGPNTREFKQPEHSKPAHVTAQLRLSGSNPMGGRLARDLLTAYGIQAGLTSVREQPGLSAAETTLTMQSSEAARTIRGEVKAYGSLTAFPDLMLGKADIGMASRQVTAMEVKSLIAAHVGDLLRPGNENVISLDGIAFIVNRSNRVPALSAGQLRGLLAGQTTRWSEVGGPDLPVVVYAQDVKSGEVDLIHQKILGRGTALARTAVLFETDEDLAEAVAAEPGAIGFVGIAYTRNAKIVSITTDCGLPPVSPSPFNIKTEEYSLSRRLYFYAGDKRSPLADDFIRFALSPEAQPAIERAGFATLEPVFVPPAPPNAQLPTAAPGSVERQTRVLREALNGARRLSITFRFDAGKIMLDSRAVADVGRLRQWTQHAGIGRSLTLVGYSSSDGDFETNVGLSRQRAHEVEARLRALGVDAVTSLGVGPIEPVVCDGGVDGANLNRRVEVWLR